MQTNPHYELISRAIQWVAEHQSEQPDLETLSNEMGVSPHHLQRTFQAWAGVSPKQFLKSLTRRAAVERLLAGSNVLDAALSIGLSGPGRLHDLLITTEALTPGEIRKRGAGIHLEYGFGETLFGQALVSWNTRGLNFLGFCQGDGGQDALAELRETWSNATFSEHPAKAQGWLDQVFATHPRQPIRLWLRGSPFQLKVWEALLAIPEGSHASYGSLARSLGQPNAARAVGSAVGANPLAWVIPCHRVIRQAGELGGYRWGEVTKHAMIGFEAANRSPSGADSATGQIHVRA
jgi:AraC family transcriptional regulator of adaptative response/methylated-DNA-[protein]-cysteine methyltransferase